jgi:hypothetical protein
VWPQSCKIGTFYPFAPLPDHESTP